MTTAEPAGDEGGQSPNGGEETEPTDADGGDSSSDPTAGEATPSTGTDETVVDGPAPGDPEADDASPDRAEPADSDAAATVATEHVGPRAKAPTSSSARGPSPAADAPAAAAGDGGDPDEPVDASPDAPSGVDGDEAPTQAAAGDDDEAAAGRQEQPDASSPVASGAPDDEVSTAPAGPSAAPCPEQVGDAGADHSVPRRGQVIRLPRGLEGRRRVLVLVAAVPVLAVVLVVLGWAIDSAVLSGQVMRNVEVAGRPVGGLGEASLADSLDAIAADVAARPVRIVAGDRAYETTAGEIGLTLDSEATAAAAVDAGRSEAAPVRPFRWIGSLFGTRDVAPRYTVSEGTVALKVAGLQGDDRFAPAEPAVVYDEDTQEFIARPGRNGVGIDARQVAAALPGAAARRATGPIEIAAERTEVAHRFTDEEAADLAAEANELTADGLTLVVEQATVRLEADRLREWIRQAPPSDGFALAIDGAAVAEDLPRLVSGFPGAPRNATVTLGPGGRPQVTPARGGVTCCTDGSAERIWDALQAGESRVGLETREAEPQITTDEARQWRIAQPVGGARGWRDGAEVPGPAPGFTTYYQPGEPRVVNIHRIADLVRGTVIPPGGTFSVNERVGERTTGNGFVEAGAISNGQHVSEVGGGVSQFATTTFNAAYFAGLDIVESQAHSEYFDRYPRGREATMGYPNPDLVIENDTPYGVLVWTSYTDTSLTVTMYSTPYARAEQTAITESRSRQCTNVETTRTRTYPDSSRETDSFRATYRPGAGVDCNGNPLPPAPGG